MQLRAISNSEFVGPPPGTESAIGTRFARTGTHAGTKIRNFTERSIQGIHRLQDLVVILIAGIVSFIVRDRVPFPEPVPAPVENLAAVIAPIALGWWTLLHLCGAYSMRGLGHGVAEYRRILVASVLTFAGLTTGLYLTNHQLPRAFVVGLFIVGVPMLMIARRMTRAMNQPEQTQDIDAMVCWMSSAPLKPRARLLVKHTTRLVKGLVKDIDYRLDINTLHRDQDSQELGLNEIGRMTMRVQQPLMVDPYELNRVTGSFILIDPGTGVTVGAGMIRP